MEKRLLGKKSGRVKLQKNVKTSGSNGAAAARQWRNGRQVDAQTLQFMGKWGKENLRVGRREAAQVARKSTTNILRNRDLPCGRSDRVEGDTGTSHFSAAKTTVRENPTGGWCTD